MTSFPSVGRPDGDIDPLQTLVSDGGRSFLFYFCCLLALAPDFAPPVRGRPEPVVRGACCDTAAGEHYGPDAQKEGE